ncbi:hypothetical protein [Streptomyces sp. NPDC052036]|uniref:hypothetical protein n=1 Tax=Streptomyces sp. NPDC052036 TaxID=3155171 RepID=UPI003434CB3E
MNILIVGGSGFLGRELAQQALATGHAVMREGCGRNRDPPVRPAAAIAHTSLITGGDGSVHGSFIHDLITRRRNGVLSS